MTDKPERGDLPATIEAWALSPEGAEKLRAMVKSAKANTDLISGLVMIDPAMLNRPMTI